MFLSSIEALAGDEAGYSCTVSLKCYNLIGEETGEVSCTGKNVAEEIQAFGVVNHGLNVMEIKQLVKMKYYENTLLIYRLSMYYTFFLV